MNQPASDAPRDDSGELTQSNANQDTEPQSSDQSGPQGVELAGDEFAGDEGAAETLAGADGRPVRMGSPFAVDPIAPQPNKKVEVLYDVGPTRYTAMGAVVASIMVLGFAAAAAWWFPTGGALIAALGCVLSIFGMYSAFRKTAGGLLAIHLGLFILCYGRSIG